MRDTTAYLDYNATAPLAPEAAEAMAPWLRPVPANPSAVHGSGQRARAAMEDARSAVSDVAGGRRVVFTSGGTEADNAALWGVLGWPPRGHLVISAVEHPAILEPAAALEGLGVAVTRVPPDRQGRVRAAAVAGALRPDTRLVSLMAANNEVGTIQPVADVVAAAHDRGVPVHCDAVQAVAWLDLAELGEVDMLTLAGHKIGGPHGIGALALGPDVDPEPFLRGGGQQLGRRPGTEPVALAAGFAAACRRAARRRGAEAPRVAELSGRLRRGLLATVSGTRATVSDAPTLPNTVHLTVEGIDAALLVARLDLEGIACSAGSACASGVAHRSHVLEAMGLDPEGGGAVRLSLGYETAKAEIDRVLERFPAVVTDLVDAGATSLEEPA